MDRVESMRETRRAILQSLLSGPRYGGDRAAFCAAAGITNGRLSQLLDPAQQFGDVAARNLCDKLGLPAGYFDATTSDPSQSDESGLDYWLSKIPRSHPLHERIKRNCMLIIIQGINAVDTPPATPEQSIDDAATKPIESHHNQPARRKTVQT